MSYDWDMTNVKGLQSSNNVPSWFNHFPYVQVSEFNNWGEVIDWAYKINTPEDNLKGILNKRVAQLKEKYGADNTGLFRAIVEVVQNEIRYMGVEIGDYSHRANNPEKVYEQRYGDCKDKSLLLVSMLRSAGISAEMALVNSGVKQKIDDDLPSPSSFNHAIVVAHISGKNIWIDPTISDQGGTGINFYFPDYGNALVLLPGTNLLTAIPEMAAGNIKYTEDYDVSEVLKPVSLTISTIYSLSEADDIRTTFANQSKSELEKNYLDYYSKIYPHIESTDTLIVKDDKDANEIETTERYTINDFFDFDSVNQNYSAGFYASMIKNVLPTVEKIKEYPIAVNYPYSIHYAIHINSPINWRIKHKNETISRNAYRFSYDVSVDNNRLSIEYTFTYLKDHIAPEEILQYEKDRKKIVDDYLSYSFTDTPARPNIHTGVNYLAILVIIFLWGGCSYAGVRIYKMKTIRNQFAYHEARSLGGWVILPVIGLIFSACKSLYSLFENGFLLNKIWHVYDGLSKAFQFKMLMWLELVFNVIIFCLTVFCLILMYKKRDILPQYIKALYVISMIVIIADSFYTHAAFPTSDIEYNNILRSVVAVCIWVPYFSKSSRVKETFVVPFPDNGFEMPPDEQSVQNEDISEIPNGNIEMVD